MNRRDKQALLTLLLLLVGAIILIGLFIYADKSGEKRAIQECDNNIAQINLLGHNFEHRYYTEGGAKSCQVKIIHQEGDFTFVIWVDFESSSLS